MSAMFQPTKFKKHQTDFDMVGVGKYDLSINAYCRGDVESIKHQKFDILSVLVLQIITAKFSIAYSRRDE